MESVTVWQVITVILLPISLMALAFLWGQLRGLRTELGGRLDRLDGRMTLEDQAIRDQIHANVLDAERRYINWKDMDDFKGDIFKRFDRLEKALQRARPATAEAED